MQPAKDAEDLAVKSGVDADAVVAHHHGDAPRIVRTRHRADDDLGLRILIVLQPVGNQIGEQLRDACRIADDVGERAFRHEVGLSALQQIDEVLANGRHDLDHIERFRRPRNLPRLAQVQKLIDERSEPTAGTDQMIDVLEPVRPQRGGVLLREQMAICLQRSQRLLQVMRDHMSECFQLAVDGAQPLIGAFELVAARTQLVGQAVPFGQIEGGTAVANEVAGLIVNGHGVQPNINDAAVLLAPLRFQLAFPRRHALGNRRIARHSRWREQARKFLPLQFLAFIAERVQERVVEGNELAVAVHAEVHHRSILVQLPIAQLQARQILADGAPLFLNRRQLVPRCVELEFLLQHHRRQIDKSAIESAHLARAISFGPDVEPDVDERFLRSINLLRDDEPA